jgi:IPT/TIG domain
MNVLSHSTQLRPTFPVPVVKQVVPLAGTAGGGTRVAILGEQFADSPTTKVRFDRFDVIPIFHGPGTLICLTPQHEPGPVMVKVTNNGRCWSDTHAAYTYEGSTSNKDGVTVATSTMGKNRECKDPFASNLWSSGSTLEGTAFSNRFVVCLCTVSYVRHSSCVLCVCVCEVCVCVCFVVFVDVCIHVCGCLFVCVCLSLLPVRSYFSTL